MMQISRGKEKKVEKEQGQKRIEKISTDWETKTFILKYTHTFKCAKILGKSLIWIHSSTNTSHPKKELLCFNCQNKSNC